MIKEKRDGIKEKRLFIRCIFYASIYAAQLRSHAHTHTLRFLTGEKVQSDAQVCVRVPGETDTHVNPGLTSHTHTLTNCPIRKETLSNSEPKGHKVWIKRARHCGKATGALSDGICERHVISWCVRSPLASALEGKTKIKEDNMMNKFSRRGIH